MMPGMDGMEVCRRLKTDERTSHIPVILLTARASTESKLEGLGTGADDYITKPFEAEELRARIRNLIEIRVKLREKYRQAFVQGALDQHMSSIDEQFLKRVVGTIEKHLSESRYETATLAYEVCMSRMNLNRKLQALTGHSTHDFIRTLRLHHAAQLLRQRSGNISEIAYEVGFSSVSHFSKAFHEQFGETPSDFVEHSSKPAAS
jgi:DNA-binding response OmpR family regulator